MKGPLSSMIQLLLISNIFSPVSPVRPIKVNLHDAATLPCSQMCSGLVTWTMFHKPRDILAQCDQTSCQSQEGFHMSHDQYLKGDLSLTITDVDYNKRGLYTCECDALDICDVNIQIASVNVHTHVHPGESVSMNVPVSEPVEVILNRTGDTKPNTVRLCEMRGRKIQCVSEYEKRVLFRSSLQLKEMKESDSGVYTIRDTWNEEVIATCTVIVGAQSRVSVNPAVKVNLHDDATLSCSQTCSGLVTWTVIHNPRDILAQCDQTSCLSQEGFHMSHDQYLKGDLSLTITDVDFTKRGWYMCECDGVDLCHVTLQIEPLRSSVQFMPGDPLVLDLPISESVEVIYNSADAAAPVQICTVEGRTLQCKPEYSQRASLMSAVVLRGTAPSDSGVYTIRDLSNKLVVQTYTVSVQEVQPLSPAVKSSTVIGLAVLLALTWAGLVAAGLIIVWQRKKKFSSSREDVETVTMKSRVVL